MAENKTKFSVLMSVYKNDNEEFVKQAIDSVLNQTVQADEFVIVLDGPVSEDIRDILESYKKNYNFIKLIPLEKNVGLGNALNIGLQECSYDIVARMDSDDISNKNRFENQIKLFDEDKELSIVGGAISEFIESPEKSVGLRKVPVTQKEIEACLKKRNPFNHMTVMFRKKDVIEAGGYQEFFYLEDYFLWLRMYLKNKKFKNIDEVLVNARVGTDMYKRRGGLKYYKSGVKLQNFMLQNKIIGRLTYVRNIAIRFIVQVLIPNNIRAYIYQKFLRKN